MYESHIPFWINRGSTVVCGYAFSVLSRERITPHWTTKKLHTIRGRGSAPKRLLLHTRGMSEGKVVKLVWSILLLGHQSSRC